MSTKKSDNSISISKINGKKVSDFSSSSSFFSSPWKSIIHSFCKLRIFFLLLFLFSYNNFEYRSADGMMNVEIADRIVETIKSEIRNNFGFFGTMLKTVFKSFTQNVVSNLLNWAIDSIKKAGEMEETRGKATDLSPIPPEVKDMPHYLDIIVKGIVRSLLSAVLKGYNVTNILLHGPPGTGKTATAMEIVKIFIEYVSKHDVEDLYGVEFELIRGAELSKLEPSALIDRIKRKQLEWEEKSAYKFIIVIFDEMDVVFGKRSTGSADRNDVVSTWLSWLGNKQKRILIIGTTNELGAVDEAIKRRMPNVVMVVPPDFSARKRLTVKYINYLAKQYGSFVVVDFDKEEEFLINIAEMTDGFAGADFENVAKKVMEESQISNGFVSKGLIIKYIYDGLNTKATFARQLSQNVISQINKFLKNEQIFVYSSYMNPYYAIVRTSGNYEAITSNMIQSMLLKFYYSPLNSLFHASAVQTLTNCSVDAASALHVTVISSVINLVKNFSSIGNDNLVHICQMNAIKCDFYSGFANNATVESFEIYSNDDVPKMMEAHNKIVKDNKK